MKDSEYYQGHKISYAHGYQEIYLPNHPRARASGSIYVHDVVAEQIIGRTLASSEVVHHIDGDKANNSVDNLMVFDSYASHVSFHSITKVGFNCDFTLYRVAGVYHCETGISLILNRRVYRSKLISADSTNPQVKISRAELCPTCGRLMSRNAKRCAICNSKLRRKIARPSKLQLKTDLQSIKSFLGVGKKYGVSDNAVRKWCKTYGLPTKSSEIRCLSAYEWSQL